MVVDKVINWIYRRAWGDSLLPDQLDDLNFDKFRDDVVSSLPQDDIIIGY